MDYQKFLLMAGAMGATIAVVWTHLRGIGTWARRWVVRDAQLPEAYEYWAVAWDHLCTHGKRFSFGYDRTFMLADARDRVRGKRIALYGFSSSVRPTLFFYRMAPILWIVSRNPTNPQAPPNYQLYWLRGTFDFARFFGELQQNSLEALDSARDTFHVTVHSGSLSKSVSEGSSSGGGDSAPGANTPATSTGTTLASVRATKVAWKYMSLPGVDRQRYMPNVIHEVTSRAATVDEHAISPECETFLRRAKTWLASAADYRERHVPWRLSALLYGKQGTGKTSFALRLAHSLDLPLHYFELSTMTNDDLRSAWNEATGHGTAVVLFDDIDRVFHGDQSVAASHGTSLSHARPGLTFDCLLNTISGAKTSGGFLLIATANDVTRIDPALGRPQKDAHETISSRPGRLDYAIEMPSTLGEAGRRRTAARILRGLDVEVIDAIASSGQADTPAQFEDRCIRAFLDAQRERCS